MSELGLFFLFFISRYTGRKRLWTLGISIFLRLCRTYVFPGSTGWMDFIQHLGVCCFVAFLAVSLLSAAFYWVLPSVAMLAAVWASTCVFLCCSKHARCFLLLAFLSCGLREGRNALIAAGTGMVILGHVENMFYNFRGLLDSMTCNLRAKSFAIHVPLLTRYCEALQWIYGLAAPPNLFDDLLSWNQTLVVSLFSPSHTFEAHMNDTKGEVLGALSHMVVMTELLSSLGQKLLALAGLLLILLSTGLFMKRFLGPCGRKYENVYITRQFVQFDEEQRHQQRPCVLPLNRKERKKYIIIPSVRLSPKERKNLGLFFLPILTHLYVWVLFAAVDFLLFRLISSMNKHLQSLPGLEAHLKLRGEVGAPSTPCSIPGRLIGGPCKKCWDFPSLTVSSGCGCLAHGGSPIGMAELGPRARIGLHVIFLWLRQQRITGCMS